MNAKHVQRSDIARQMDHIAELLTALSQDMAYVSEVDMKWELKADEISAASSLMLEWAAAVRGGVGMSPCGRI